MTFPIWRRRKPATWPSNERQNMENTSDYFDDLQAHEGCCTWLYCDSRGYVTTGIGNLVADADACAALPWQHALANVGGSPAPVTDEQKRTAYANVLNAFGPTKPSAMSYRSISDLRLTLDFVVGLVEQRLEAESIPGIQELCPSFDEFPLPARRALVDMAYNLGVHGLSHFNLMLTACNARDWATAARQCHRSTCRDSRNDWTAQMFASCT